MIETRAFIEDLSHIKAVLEIEHATLQGKYTIHDTIYRSADESVSLADEFLRLRVIPENIWDEKEVILALKQTKLRAVGKDSHVPLQLQFDRKEDAEAYYAKHLQREYVRYFGFWRIGWQYFLPNGDIVDLEIIENNHPSLEMKSETDEGMTLLLRKFGIDKSSVIEGPLAVAMRDMIGK